eukprot:TRINITY_DN111657_c0_g1_i1.p1 TRINITY_DN111657_c0_g1~~TRINITY_DN111657_c0_g1_i1.p1  ORF type:complete len:568 (+),score=140.64 TRINITY_DN111657_c0_g1_i1:95-1798(+)
MRRWQFQGVSPSHRHTGLRSKVNFVSGRRTSVLASCCVLVAFSAAVCWLTPAWIGSARPQAAPHEGIRYGTGRLPRHLWGAPSPSPEEPAATEAPPAGESVEGGSEGEAAATDEAPVVDGQPRVPLEELKVGSEVMGKVIRNSIAFGVNMNIGAERLGRLKIPKDVVAMEWNGKLKQDAEWPVVIDAVDLGNRRVTIKLKDDEATIAAWKAERKELSAFSVGAEVDGYVVEKKKGATVYVDFGAVVSGRLTCDASVCRRLEWGEELKGMKVAAVDGETQSVTLTLDGIEQVVAGREDPGPLPKKAKKNGKDGKNGGATADGDSNLVQVEFKLPRNLGTKKQLREKVMRGLTVDGFSVDGLDFSGGVISLKPSGQGSGSNAKKQEGSAPKEAAPPKRVMGEVPGLATGSLVDGTVTVRNSYGVFVNIGQETDAKLNVTKDVVRRVNFGEKLTGLRVDGMMSDTKRIWVSFTDSSVPEAIAAREDTRKPLDQLEEGQVVEGYIADKGPKGTLVDIGAMRMGRLKVPNAVSRGMPLGQLLTGLKVTNLEKEKLRFELVLPESETAQSESS